MCLILQAADREAEVRSLHCQAATLADDAETAQLRAERAESRMHELHEETGQLRDTASQSCAKEQVSQRDLTSCRAQSNQICIF